MPPKAKATQNQQQARSATQPSEKAQAALLSGAPAAASAAPLGVQSATGVDASPLNSAISADTQSSEDALSLEQSFEAKLQVLRERVKSRISNNLMITHQAA